MKISFSFTPSRIVCVLECVLFEHKNLYMFMLILPFQEQTLSQLKTLRDHRRVQLHHPTCTHASTFKWSEKKPWNANRFSRTANVFGIRCTEMLPVRSKNGNDLLVTHPPGAHAAQSVPFLGTKQWVFKNRIALRFPACVVCHAINSSPFVDDASSLPAQDNDVRKPVLTKTPLIGTHFVFP